MGSSSPLRALLGIRRSTVGLWSVLAVAGCASASNSEPAHAASAWRESEQQTCFRLLHSPPTQWPEALPPTLQLGPRAAAPLANLVNGTPHAPGAPAATLAIGMLAAAEQSGLLQDLLGSSNEAVAVEAALALGRRRLAADTLRRIALSPSPQTLLRTAAAAGAVQTQPAPEMLGFLCDVVLAATPYGRARGEELGLPVDRPRWAAERNLASEALNAVAGRDLGIEPDASWPELRAAVERARQHFGLPSR